MPIPMRPMFAIAVLAGSTAVLTAPAAAFAQIAEIAPHKQASAVRVPSGSMRVDGRMDEETWRLAPPVTDFIQSEPEENAAPTEPMDVKFLYDDDALFVGARMYSRNPAAIQAPMSRRDEDIDQTEHMFVSLDTYLDKRTAYTFGVTAAGVRFDQYHSTDNRGRPDSGFDPVWEARVSVDDQGWIAELRIPFNQLRFNAGETQVWGLNIYRAVPSRNEEVYWSLLRRTERVWASRFGELRGIAGIRPTRRIELLPYVGSSSTMNGLRDPQNPFDNGHLTSGHTGADLKMGLGPNVTLDATINPDFGQVEADPAEVNLSAFETFFDERRPFFVEGSRLLAGDSARQSWESGTEYFYSRRIGAKPAGRASGDFVDYPATSTILGAGKITGRLSSGTSIGMLGAVTGGEFARSYDIGSTLTSRAKVAPVTTFGVGRVQQEFGRAGSTAGLMVTTTHRDMAADEPLAALLTKNAFTVSGDSVLRFKGGEYEISSNIGLSHVAGAADAIARLQRSSARYFQRPDAAYIQYDPSRTSMSGMRGGISAERTGGRHWLWKAASEFVSPEFEVNDVGRLSRADDVFASGELTYRETRPGRLFRNYEIELGHQREWNFNGDLQAASAEVEAGFTWPNFWRTSIDLGLDLPAQDARLTRGGPLMQTPKGWSASTRMSNSSASNTRGSANVSYGRNADGGLRFEAEAGIELRPTPRWQLSFEPGYERRVDDQQFVTAVDRGPLATFGQRYVFAFVDRSTISSEIRLNYAFKPDINLEFYGEPFAASGRYYDFGELIAPGGRARRIYAAPEALSQADGSLVVGQGASRFTLRNRDFNVLSFRSNLVLRWEWRPGSTFYVVWQQDREEADVRPTRVSVRDLFGSFGASGNNVFAVKTTFWLGVR